MRTCVNCGREYADKDAREGSNACPDCQRAMDLLKPELERLQKVEAAYEDVKRELRDTRDRERQLRRCIDLLAEYGHFGLGSYNGPNGLESSTESRWFYRTEAIFKAPGPFKPVCLQEALARFLAAERRSEAEAADELPTFRQTPPLGVEYELWVKSFGAFLHKLQSMVWGRTCDRRPDTLLASPSVWPIIEAQDGFEAADLPRPVEGWTERAHMGILRRHGLSVVIDPHYTAGHGEVRCSEGAGVEYIEKFRIED